MNDIIIGVSKEELTMIVNALECKLDCENDTCTESLWDLEQKFKNNESITEVDFSDVRRQLDTNIDNLLILKSLLIRLQSRV